MTNNFSEPSSASTPHNRGKTPVVNDLDRVVREVVIKALNIETESFEMSDDANLFDLGADSMSIVDLFLQLEERFDVKFEEAQIRPEMFKRLADLVEFVRSQVEARPS